VTLIASLGYVIRHRPKQGRKPVLFDVGDGRMWSVQEICKHTGCKLTAVYERIAAGKTGADLLASAGRWAEKVDVGDGVKMTAMEIARHLGTAYSTVKERQRKGLAGRALLARVPRRETEQ
jgi:hypothetical protein